MRRFLLALIALVVVAAVAATALVYKRLREPFKGYSGAEQFVDIPSGSGARAIAKRLAGAGIVRDEITFVLALRVTGKGSRLKAGEYRFDHPLRPAEVVEQLAEGRVYLRHITFPEGLTIREMSRIYEAQGLGPAATFVAAAEQASLIHDLDPKASDLEGYLFPDTYSLPRSATAEHLVRAMVDRFRNVLASERAQVPAVESGASKAVESGFSRTDIRRVVTLASIVEKETGKPEERPTVAAVYTNRLRRGMGLQCDPTVIYALQRAGTYTGNLTKDDLAFDSPYNTYRYAGLPPGPIASPGQASIQAALAPAAVPSLYFVSRNDGSHVFATTLAEHNHNVFTYQVLPFRQKRLGEQRQKKQPQKKPPQSPQRSQRSRRSSLTSGGSSRRFVVHRATRTSVPNLRANLRPEPPSLNVPPTSASVAGPRSNRALRHGRAAAGTARG